MSFDLKIMNGDFVINNGLLQAVVDSDKLIQQILKICLTTAGSNPFNPSYGSFLSRTIIGTAIDTSILVQVAKSQLNTCLQNLQSIQSEQVKSFQRVSADEQLAAINSISIAEDPIDPRKFNVKISVVTKGLKPISTGFKISAI